MKIKFWNGSSLETIDTTEQPKRGQRAKIYPIDDYKEPSVCDECEIGDGWECQFCCSKCYEDYDGELPDGYCDNCDLFDI